DEQGTPVAPENADALAAPARQGNAIHDDRQPAPGARPKRIGDRDTDAPGPVDERARPANIVQTIEVYHGRMGQQIRPAGEQRARADQAVLLGIGKDDADTGTSGELVERHED